MRKPFLLLPLALALPLTARGAGSVQWPCHLPGKAPTHCVFSDGTALGLTVKYQFDIDRFSHDDGYLQNAQTNRRKELGAYLKKKGVYDAIAVFDFQARSWLDVYLRLQSKALFGTDAGAVRLGFSKTPVGFEGNTGTGSTTFLETALPTQAIYAGRRIGVDWALLRPAYVIDAGYYSGGDLQGDSDGHMLAAHAAWTPRNLAGDVLHLGLSASRETPQASTDGRGITQPSATRLRARPEAGLLTRRLLDSGALTHADRVDRRGLEALWIRGPWSLQGEYLREAVHFSDGRPDFRGEGYYAFASWVVTGESRRYAAGNVGDVIPRRASGAVELAIRYSQLDLNSSPTLGGREHDWTVGANWYLNSYLKLQANYVDVSSTRRGVRIDPHIVELRAQINF